MGDDGGLMLNLMVEPAAAAAAPAARARGAPHRQLDQQRGGGRGQQQQQHADERWQDARVEQSHQRHARRPGYRLEQHAAAPARLPKTVRGAVEHIFGGGGGGRAAAVAAGGGGGNGGAAATAAAGDGPGAAWVALGVPATLAAHLASPRVGAAAPTRVQRLALPPLLARRDVLVQSETGSGKTLAFLVPIAAELLSAQPRLCRADGTRALVLSPTRELAAQTAEVAATLLRPFPWLVPGAVLGGENRQHEKARLRKGVTLLCATPGRLLDHMKSTASLAPAAARCSRLVFDEADRLLDMGFEPAVRELLELLDAAAAARDGDGGQSPAAGVRCTALVSATLPQSLERLTRVALRDPVRITLLRAGDAPPGQAASAAEVAGGAAGSAPLALPLQLAQGFYVVPAKMRLAALLGVLARWAAAGVSRALVFFSSCESCDFHHRMLCALRAGGGGRGGGGGDGGDERGDALPLVAAPLLRLHGGLPPEERRAVFRDFGAGGAGVLLCTDVAARGLDFANVGATLQVDIGPPEQYCHRVGRAARIGHEGEALLFVLPSELAYVDALRAVGAAVRQRALLELLSALGGRGKAAAKGGKSGQRYGGGGASWAAVDPGDAEAAARHPAARAALLAAASVVAADGDLHSAAEGAFVSHVRSYAALPAELKSICHVKRLHLGHVAAAFGLTQPPSNFGAARQKAGGGSQRKRRRHGRDDAEEAFERSGAGQQREQRQLE